MPHYRVDYKDADGNPASFEVEADDAGQAAQLCRDAVAGAEVTGTRQD
jgi:hypothetical protein